MSDVVDNTGFAYESKSAGRQVEMYTKYHPEKALERIRSIENSQPEPATQQAETGTLQMHKRATLCL